MEATGLVATKTAVTIEKALEDFLTDVEKNRKVIPSTMRKYNLLSRTIREFCQTRGYIFLSQLGAEQMTQFRNTWTFGARSHVKQLERLKSFFKFCVDMEWLAASPTRSFKPPKVTDAGVVPFSEKQVADILAACDKFNGNRARLKALVDLMLASGLRIGDAVMISKEAFLKSGRDEYSVTLRTEKGGVRVTCPIPETAATQVLALDGDQPFPHQFRHTFAKRLLMADVPVGTVAKLLGHRRVAVTEQHYSRWIPERQAAIDVVVRDSWAKMAGTPPA
jgi:site-specific recombinase XerD